MFCLQLKEGSDQSSGIAYPGYVDGFDLWSGAYWGLLTAFFLHAGITHIAFNMYWLYRFGTALEPYIGWPRYLLFWVVGTAVSGMMQVSFSGDVGVGASGLVYALFGLILLGKQSHPYLAQLLDPQTILLFILWLLLCFVLTWTGVMAIANWAHVGGFLFGALCGYAFLERNELVWKLTTAAVALLSFFPLFYAPWLSSWNLAQGVKAYDREKYDAAIVYLEHVDSPDYDAFTLEMLARSFSALGRNKETAEVYKNLLSQHSEADLTEAAYVYNEYAWILATSPDDSLRNPQDAVHYATLACEKDEYKNSDDLDTLAAAYAADNQFDQAVTWEQKAIALNSDAPALDELKAHLKLFQSQKPYRDSAGSPSASGGT
jgi:membrane associated rhomboid family serine protease